MKAIKTPLTGPFAPFSITIDVETREEAQALYAIFNHSDNCELLYTGNYIRNIIGSEYHVSDKDGVIANGMTYAQYYRSKQ